MRKQTKTPDTLQPAFASWTIFIDNGPWVSCERLSLFGFCESQSHSYTTTLCSWNHVPYSTIVVEESLKF